MKQTYSIPLLVLAFLLCIYCFLVGIHCLSSAFTLLTGPFATSLFNEIRHPLIGFFVGVFATAVMQSSSATTSIGVTMVAAELITLQEVIPMFMGAHIGTTVTNSIVSLGTITHTKEFKRAFAASTIHDFFNILTASILLPLELMFHGIEKSSLYIFNTLMNNGIDMTTEFKSPIKVAIEALAHQFEKVLLPVPLLYILVSLIIILTSLTLLIRLLKNKFLKKMEQSLHKKVFTSPLKSWSLGAFFTFIVQSSSVTTSLVIPFASDGTLKLKEIYPYTVGANFGTGFTTFLAALSLNHIAFVAAIASMFFDIFGTFFLYPVPILGDIPLWCAQGLADISGKYKIIPFVYLLIIFILLPLIIILF